MFHWMGTGILCGRTQRVLCCPEAEFRFQNVELLSAAFEAPVLFSVLVAEYRSARDQHLIILLFVT